MRKLIPALFLFLTVTACNEITKQTEKAETNEEEMQNAENGNELIKDANGTVLYEVHKEKINDEYGYKFLKGKLGYTLNFDAVDAEAMFEERLKMGNNDRFELYYKGKLTFVDSTAFMGLNTDYIGAMFDFFERKDTLIMHFFPDKTTRKQFQEVRFYEGDFKSVEDYEYGPVESMDLN